MEIRPERFNQGRPVSWSGLRMLRHHVSAPRPASFVSRLTSGVLQGNRNV